MASLPPLEADAFARFVWERGPRKPGTHPLTVEDYAFDMQRIYPDLTPGEVREAWEHVAARMRSAGGVT